MLAVAAFSYGEGVPQRWVTSKVSSTRRPSSGRPAAPAIRASRWASMYSTWRALPWLTATWARAACSAASSGCRS